MSYPTYFGSLRHGNLHKVIRKRKKNYSRVFSAKLTTRYRYLLKNRDLFGKVQVQFKVGSHSAHSSHSSYGQPNGLTTGLSPF